MATLDQLLKIVTVERLNDDAVPSASIALLEDGKITTHVITKGREDPETVYQACSISKAITALAVAKLIDQGRFTYDTKVAEHLPQSIIDCIVDEKTAQLMQHVTVGMLVSHTSGLSQHGFPGYTGDPPTAEDVLSGRPPSNTPRVRFNTFPGAQYDYSGGGWTVMQVFLEQITSTKFDDLMRNTVLKPLGMTRSHYGRLAPNEKNYATAHDTAYTEADNPYHNFTELAAAGLWTTPTDLLKAISAIQGSLQLDSGFLQRETAKHMLTRPSQSEDRKSLALGWAADDSVFGHPGANYPGYQCWAGGSHGGVVNLQSAGSSKMPDNCGVAIMTNSIVGFESIQKIVGALWHLTGWPRVGSLAGNFGKDEYVPYALVGKASIGDSWRDWVGDWGSDWRLTDEGGPHLVYKEYEPMRLVGSASPADVLEGGKHEHILVVDGLCIAARLTWEHDERVLVLKQADPAVTTLHSSAGRST